MSSFICQSRRAWLYMPDEWRKILPNALNMWVKWNFQVVQWFCTWEAALLQEDWPFLLIEFTDCTLELAGVNIFILCMLVLLNCGMKCCTLDSKEGQQHLTVSWVKSVIVPLSISKPWECFLFCVRGTSAPCWPGAAYCLRQSWYPCSNTPASGCNAISDPVLKWDHSGGIYTALQYTTAHIT